MNRNKTTALGLMAFSALGGAASAQGAGAASAAELFAQAQQYAKQANVAQPQANPDHPLWKSSLSSAEAAAKADAQNREYAAYLAQLYTKTGWWINAYNSWKALPNLSPIERQWASLAASNLADLALARGDKQSARVYLQQGMAWADNQKLRQLWSRL